MLKGSDVKMLKCILSILDSHSKTSKLDKKIFLKRLEKQKKTICKVFVFQNGAKKL